MFLIFDTETTGLPRDASAPLTQTDNWPRIVQLAWQLHDQSGKFVESGNFIIKPAGFTIPYNAESIHGISTEMALKLGTEIEQVLDSFEKALNQCKIIVGHHIEFDTKILAVEYIRLNRNNPLEGKLVADTMMLSTDFCQLPGGKGGAYKYPSLDELYQKLFGTTFSEAHNAVADVAATARCFFELIRLGIITHEHLNISQDVTDAVKENYPRQVPPFELQVESHHKISRELSALSGTSNASRIQKDTPDIQAAADRFVHLHVHSQFSVLEATASPEEIVKAAVAAGMKAVALTDHGNLFGAFDFYLTAREYQIKPIIGCEFYLVNDRKKRRFTRENPDRRTQQVLLAKNLTGYRNLSKLCSLGWIEGLYDDKPRIDKEILLQYKDGLIALSGGLNSEINDLILNFGEEQAEKAFCWWKENFGDDFYIEINRHHLPEEERVNQVLLKWAAKYQVKIVAANNVYYLTQEDADLHDTLLCIKHGEVQSTPIGYGRGKRFGFPNKEYYFKTGQQMAELFADLPEALLNTAEVADKIEIYTLEHEPIMPHFDIPEGFSDANEYLRYLTYQGASERYGTITEEIRQRIDYELETIRKMGYPGYFLIIEDILRNARKMGIWIGPGRGSAAGSVVAYCLKITNIDPLQYGLLFERFLNPDRISLPDIDIDIDEDGRDLLLKFIAEKYGYNRVAHIITFGKMAPKMAIRDVARVKELELSEADRLAKLIPGRPGTTFSQAYQLVRQLQEEKKSSNPKIVKTLEIAEKLEGTVRNIGTHACGIIITKDDLTNHIPVAVSKDTDLLVTQYDGTQIEQAGMLKIDFLGLKTLSILKDTVELIQKTRGIHIDIDKIPHDDEKTFQLFSRGDTTGIFQFESEGMKKNLRKLKPNRFEDLIAMNGLYRPGPMEFIPSYIARKHGKEKVEYEIPEMQQVLEETYGITVYQEQVMQLSQILAGFSAADADVIRKAMGKKNTALLEKLKPKFLAGAAQRNHKPEIINRIWENWYKFGEYAFNKSHATCYAYIAYREAYLKAHYPAEFMAATLSRNLNDISKITFYLDEARQMGFNVLKPDVNESELNFSVNQKGEIRFGLAAIKGLGTSVAEAIIEERRANGPYASIFDFARRINLKVVNKRSFEALAMAGAFDSFKDFHRAMLFHKETGEDQTFAEKLIRYAQKYQEQKNVMQASLFRFDETIKEVSPDPPLPSCEPWSTSEQLKKEKEVTGFYISSHPLDKFKLEIKYLTNCTINDLRENLQEYEGRTIVFGGMVINASHRMTKDNKPWATFTVEDFQNTIELRLFSDDYVRFKNYLTEEYFLLITGIVQKRFKNDEEYDIKITDIQLLAEAFDKKIKKIRLILNLPDITPRLADSLYSLIQQYQGNCEVVFQVFDEEDNIRLSLNQNKYKVQLSEFLRHISEIPQIHYQLEK